MRMVPVKWGLVQQYMWQINSNAHCKKPSIDDKDYTALYSLQC